MKLAGMLAGAMLMFVSLQAQGEGYLAKVIAVFDGDTVMVIHNGRPQRIRLADIDAPEKDQESGLESRQSLEELVSRKQLTVIPVDVDKYGRIVAILILNGLNINQEQVRRGMAWDYTHFNDDRHVTELEADARKAKRGLWARAHPVPPWEWRRTHAYVNEKQPVEVLGEQDFKCGSKRGCSQMHSCDEAFFYLNACNLKSLNPDGDGIPCKNLCLPP